MLHFILRRLLYLVPVWVGISLVAFLLTNLTPGDPARLALQRELGRQPPTEETAAAREQMGLNDPAPIRYVTWLGDAVTGDRVHHEADDDVSPSQPSTPRDGYRRGPRADGAQ